VNEAIETFVTVGDRRLYVRDHPGSSPAIVAMHGFPDDSRIYNRLIPALVPLRVVTFDWSGYGRSTRRDPAQFHSTDRQREMLAVLDEVGLDHVVLVGHDSSGPEAIDFAAAHPERVAHVVLLNTYYGRNPALRLPEMIALLADPAFAPLADALLDDPDHRLWLLAHTARRFGLDEGQAPDGIAATSIIPQFFGDIEQPDALAEIRAWTADIPNALDRQDAAIATGRLHSVTRPVSVIFGRNDPYLNPDVAQHISGLIKYTQLHLLDQASHWPQWDQPDTVADLIKQTIATPAPPNTRT
jgi:pimeloyl-ACP methyl ester carboxylesterase